MPLDFFVDFRGTSAHDGAMSNIIEPADLTPEQIEDVEKMSARYVFQGICDFAAEAHYIFSNSPDSQKDVAEDVTREALGRLPGFPLPARIFGVMDFKRAGYVFLPSFATRQALLVDSKAEKAGAVARLQISQTSMPVRQVRAGKVVECAPGLKPEMLLHGREFLTTTVFVHYHYKDKPEGGRILKKITVATLPSGRLATAYVPDAHNTIWVAGPNAPSREEKFRARLSFRLLRAKCRWRIQRLAARETQEGQTEIVGGWSE
jgi:hypothetical protein